MAIAAAGRETQIVGRVGDDASADAVLQDLARAGVGHVAILRDPARPTPLADGRHGIATDPAPEVDGADVELALRYLTEFRVIVQVGPATAAVTDVVGRATEWAEAALIIANPSSGERGGLPDVLARAQVVRRDESATEAEFEARVVDLAVGLDASATLAG